MHTKEKTSTMRLPPKFYKEYADFYLKHEKALEKIGIDDISKLIRWCANEGKTIVDAKLQIIEEN
jgi:hypothetical protein